MVGLSLKTTVFESVFVEFFSQKRTDVIYIIGRGGTVKKRNCWETSLVGSKFFHFFVTWVFGDDVFVEHNFDSIS